MDWTPRTAAASTPPRALVLPQSSTAAAAETRNLSSRSAEGAADTAAGTRRVCAAVPENWILPAACLPAAVRAAKARPKKHSLSRTMMERGSCWSRCEARSHQVHIIASGSGVTRNKHIFMKAKARQSRSLDLPPAEMSSCLGDGRGLAVLRHCLALALPAAAARCRRGTERSHPSGAVTR